MTDMIDSPPPMSAEAALPDCLRVIGFPGAFLDWGVAMLRAQIEARGRAAETVWLPLAEGVAAIAALLPTSFKNAHLLALTDEAQLEYSKKNKSSMQP